MPRLLVIDDALIMRTMIGDAAREAGWEIVGEATNGQEAIDLYSQTRPDVATLDMVMPEFDGLYGLRGIMQLDPHAKVVVVSALEQKQVLTDAFKAGATDFIVKPFNRAALIETLNKLVGAGV